MAMRTTQKRCLVTLKHWESGSTYFLATPEELDWLEDLDAPIPLDFKKRYLEMREWEGFPITEETFESPSFKSSWDNPEKFYFERANDLKELNGSEGSNFFTSLGKAMKYVEKGNFEITSYLEIDLYGMRKKKA